tara:strand:- start:1598 stop:2212 length:615 start_codon:yes stop_codon:yes gene_type:complete
LNILLIVILVICYLIGSVQNGILLSKIFYKLDIRNFGSKSTGATNVNRVLGVKPGIIVLILDILKGLIPILILRIFLDNEIIAILASCSIVIGHCFPLYHKFKGGKGVATGFGSVILHLPIIIVVLIPSLPIIYISKYVSLGSVIGSFLSIILILYLVLTNNISSDYLYIGLIIPSIILFKHYQNIKRLINKTESKISFTNGSK